jgi:AhpD family alkylhydroperoxidase
MITDWKSLISNMNGGVKALRDSSPGIMKAFSEMGRVAHAGEALDHKTKELIALAIGVATRCSPCIAYHAEGAAKAGASREEIAETLAMSVYMGAGPSVMYAAHALEAYDQLNATS